MRTRVVYILIGDPTPKNENAQRKLETSIGENKLGDEDVVSSSVFSLENLT